MKYAFYSMLSSVSLGIATYGILDEAKKPLDKFTIPLFVIAGVFLAITTIVDWVSAELIRKIKNGEQ